MKTIILDDLDAANLLSLLNKVISAGKIFDERKFKPTYGEVMTAIAVALMLERQSDIKQ